MKTKNTIIKPCGGTRFTVTLRMQDPRNCASGDIIPFTPFLAYYRTARARYLSVHGGEQAARDAYLFSNGRRRWPNPLSDDRGHSLSTGDIVQIVDNETLDREMFLCLGEGWVPISERYHQAVVLNDISELLKFRGSWEEQCPWIVINRQKLQRRFAEI